MRSTGLIGMLAGSFSRHDIVFLIPPCSSFSSEVSRFLANMMNHDESRRSLSKTGKHNLKIFKI